MIAAAIIALSVLGLVALYKIFSRLPVCKGGKTPGRWQVKPPIDHVMASPEAIQYGVQSLQTPKVTGWLFEVLIRLAYSSFGRLVVVPKLMHKSNVDLMGGVYLPESPTLYATPPSPPDLTDYSEANRGIIERLLKRAVERETGKVFHLPTVADYVRAFQSGVCTPTDVARAVLAAIAESNSRDPPLRAIVDTKREVVLAMAEASSERWKRGRTLSPLDGIPVAVKGQFVIEPYVTRGGAEFVSHLSNNIPEAAVVRKMKEAGAVIIGVANLQEFGSGTLGSNPNRLHLTARNPYNPTHYPGGSSAGSAVSVAAGLCPVAIGTDGGGSIRIPAATCGVVGIKPTNRFIDLTGCLAVSYSVGATGPLCSSVLDAAIALDVLSRETGGDEKRISLEGLGELSLEGVRVGIYWEFFEHADEEIVTKCKRAVDQLKSLGAQIVEIKIPELEEIRIAHVITISSEIANALAVDIDEHFSEFNLETLLLAAAGINVSALEYINAQKQRTRAIAVLKQIFKNVDIILTPATACVAPNISLSALSRGIADGLTTARMMRFSSLGNFTGVPGLVVPVGYTRGGLPIGLQLMGQWYEERTLLKVAMAMEESGAFPPKQPQVFYDVIGNASGTSE